MREDTPVYMTGPARSVSDSPMNGTGGQLGALHKSTTD